MTKLNPTLHPVYVAQGDNLAAEVWQDGDSGFGIRGYTIRVINRRSCDEVGAKTLKTIRAAKSFADRSVRA